jgi:circadian clock protein KaiC
VNRIKTGIEGLDKMLDGGLPERHHVLVCGGPGTGKTMFCTQFLYKGAKEGEKGVFISLEEPPEKIIENVKSCFSSWGDFQELVDKNMLTIQKVYPASSDDPETNFSNFVDVLQAHITQNKAKRIVVDSATILSLSFSSEAAFRKNLFRLLEILNNMDSTVIFTAELPSSVRENQVYTLEQFVADGVVMLYSIPMKEKRINAVEVLKMRGANHSKDICPMRFTPEGIVVYPDERIY